MHQAGIKLSLQDMTLMDSDWPQPMEVIHIILLQSLTVQAGTCSVLLTHL